MPRGAYPARAGLAAPKPRGAPGVRPRCDLLCLLAGVDVTHQVKVQQRNGSNPWLRASSQLEYAWTEAVRIRSGLSRGAGCV